MRGEPLPDEPAPSVELSAEQARLVEEFGYPETFTLLLYAAADGSGPRRTETWLYHDLQTSFSFLDGRFVTSASLKDTFSGATFAAYRPTAFAHGMRPAAVRAMLGTPAWVRLPLDELEVPIEGLEGLVLYFADRLILGFTADELVLVQSVPGAPLSSGGRP